jgi:hypothetical protein
MLWLHGGSTGSASKLALKGTALAATQQQQQQQQQLHDTPGWSLVLPTSVGGPILHALPWVHAQLPTHS